jgi:hypothetical protein
MIAAAAAAAALQVHIAALRLLLDVCKDVAPAALAGYLGKMLRATADSRAAASRQTRDVYSALYREVVEVGRLQEQKKKKRGYTVCSSGYAATDTS